MRALVCFFFYQYNAAYALHNIKITVVSKKIFKSTDYQRPLSDYIV